MAKPPMPEELDLPDISQWDEASKKRLLEKLQETEAAKVWFCMRGRSCDGKPHEGADHKHARGDQWPPPGTDWDVFLMRGGRGSGKTRAGSEVTRALATKGRKARLSIIGPTLPHVRDTMVEGESGLLAVFDRAKTKVLWEPSKRRLTVPGTESVISAFTGEEPERLRGPQHEWVWLDEPAHYPLIQDVWDNMMFGLRLGKRPWVMCTTTPLPTKWFMKLINDPRTKSTVASTYANLDNLAPTFKRVVLDKYQGTRLGQQELYGEVLEDVEGALWKNADILHETNLTFEDMERIIVAIDPSGTSDKKRDEVGIIVVGKLGREYFVLEDASGTYTPDGWGKKAWEMLIKYRADAIVAEKNYGGDMVRSVIENARPDKRALGKVELVHSRRGKKLRAEPVAALYEQHRVYHLDVFTTLEEQQTTWVPGIGDSPDRIDALVHGVIELSDGDPGETGVATPMGKLVTKPGPSGLKGLSLPGTSSYNHTIRTLRTTILRSGLGR